MKRHLLSRMFVAAGALTLSGAAFAGQPLFSGQATPNARAAQAAAQLGKEPGNARMRVMRTNAAVVDRATIELDLLLGADTVSAVLDKATVTTSGSLIWSGHLKNAKRRSALANEVVRDEKNSVILVRRGNGITGNVRVNGKLFEIRPLPDGTHAVIEVDESRFPADHPAGSADLVPALHDAGGNRRSSTNAVAAADTTNTVIRVTAFATSDAIADYSGDMQALVELAVAESNQGYVNSGVNITMELTGYQSVTYTESSTFDTNLDRFAGTSDGYMDGIHAIRDQQYGDIALLIIKNSQYCGVARTINATVASDAYAIVARTCATGYYSFAHEVGHLQGARHDTAVDSATTPYAYGHGYVEPGKTWRTVMAYPCGVGCNRINYWSNPGKTYNGGAMGTADINDNHRVLNETRATIAGFRGEPSGNTAPVANFSFSTSDLTATFTDSSTDSDGSIASRSWNFGDGTTSTVTNPSKTYAAAGTYNVALTVTDNGGATHTVTKSVTVTTSGNVLTKGVAATGLSAAIGGYVKYTMDVPAGASNLTFTMSGGTGDADMYVKFGSEPTDSVYDCRPYKSGNAETCTFATPSAGKYYVNLKGYSAFSGVSLVGDYSTGPITQTYTNTTDYTIGDNTTVDSPITVSGRSGNGLSSTQVAVNIVHTYIGDLKVDLVAPDGSIYNLHNHTGSSTDNINQTYTVNLSTEALNGAWKLRVNDNAAGDTGYINSWSITF